MYLVITDKSQPRKLAFSYLGELSKEFWTSYGPKVEGTKKPYAFVGFGMAIISFPLNPVLIRLTSRYVYVEDSRAIPKHS